MGIVEYENGEFVAGAGGVGQSKSTHPALADGMWDTDTQQPIALACFNPYGTGEKDLIFVAGMVYEFEMDSDEASYEGIALSSGHEAARYGYKQVFETDKIWLRSEKCYYGEKNDETDNIWIGTVSVGNFMNDPNGGEQIIFEHGRKRDDKSEYRHDLVIVKPDGSGGLCSDYKCINNDPSTAYRSNIDFAAIDYDDDGMLMKFKAKSAYFSDPSVVAVLQAAPYFADLEQIEPDYIEDGETVFGQTSGSGTSTTNGFSVTASAVTGYTQETSFLGLVKLGGGEWTVEVAASMGSDFENATEVSYSTEYTSDSREDRVVLSMTPYIRYVYDMYIPEFTVPTKDEYDSTMATLTGTEAEQYEDEVMAAIDSGYSWGDTVPAGTTEYVVCMPKTPRMSMIEVSTYDKVAEANGYEKIHGNVLNETIGNPATYPYSSSGLENFDGGKDVVGENADVENDNFIWISKGGGSVTQSIEVTESDSKSITWGTALSTNIQTDIAGFIIGGGIGADYTGSHTWSNYSSTVCSGTVAGIPADAVDLGYEFKWRFGQWKDKLNNEECIVLGYLVNEVNAPPYAPLNLTVKDTTDTTVTLNWKHPSSMGTNYEIYLVTDNPSSPYYKLATVPSSTTEYVVTGLSPNTNYDFMMRSINETKTSAFTVPVTGRTRYSADDNVPVTQPVADRYAVAGSDPSFEVTVTPAQGGGDVTYQWQRLETDGSVSSWADIAGETNSTLTLSDVDKSMDGNMYRCTIAQFVNGNVAYVYTNAATLYVGAGETETRLSVEPGYGTAAGSYQVGIESEKEVERNLTVTIGGSEYALSKDETDGYIITLNGDSDAQYTYIPTESGKAKLDEAAVGNRASVALEESDVKPLTGIYEYVNEEGVSTGITEDSVMVDETGVISVGGDELEYSQTYTDGNKKLYAVVTTYKDENADGSFSEKTSTEYYYDDDTTDPSNEIISVSSEQTGYSDGGNEYSFNAATAVTVKVTETETVYETQNVEADPVTVTAEVESLSSGVTVTPNGTVEFTFRNNDTGIETKQRISLPQNSGTNINNVSYTWMPSVAGNYTITARYIESVELMSSISNEGSYTAYTITSDKGSQVQRSLVFGCSDSILIGEEIDMKPTLQETTVSDNGSDITDISVVPTELTADKVTYSVALEYGGNAEGRYVFNGNVFHPSQPGSYIVTAEYKYTDGEGGSTAERTLSVSKTINVRSSAQNVQQQIFFAYSSLTKNSTDTNIINPLTNPNAGATVEFTSSNDKVATVAQDGTITPVGAGTTTITAVSKLEGKDDVSASYLLTIRKASVTITAPDINITYGDDSGRGN